MIKPQQAAPLGRKGRVSSDSAWPLRGADGKTFAERRNDAALQERAAIVRWLRIFWDGVDDEDLKCAADAIEAGDHLKEQSK